MRYRLLWVIALQKTPAAFATATGLLQQHQPRKGEAYSLFQVFRDSLELTKTIYKNLLPLLKDSVAAWELISLTENMLDSGLITIDDLVPYKQDLYTLADVALKKLKGGIKTWYNYHALIRILPLLKDPTANLWLRKFLLQSNIYIKKTAARALLQHGQPVETAEWIKLAADKEMRTSVYEDLVELNKTQLFPKQYYTEQAFAESGLYNIVSEDNDIKKWTFIGERIVTWQGQRRKFYLYRIETTDEEEVRITRLGIAGPYSLKPGKPTAEADLMGVYWDKPYDVTKTDALLKAWLKQQEQYEE